MENYQGGIKRILLTRFLLKEGQGLMHQRCRWGTWWDTRSDQISRVEDDDLADSLLRVA